MTIALRQSRRRDLPGIVEAFHGYDDTKKQNFRDAAKSVLEDLIVVLGLVAGTYDLRWNAGGVAVSGEWTLHTDALYIQVSAGGYMPVLYRRCTGRRDYTGGRNRWATAEDLCDVVGFTTTLRTMLANPQDR